MNVQEFLNTSLTAYHTVDNCCRILTENGFAPYTLATKAKKGGKYYLKKNSSAIVAFKVGDLTDYAFNIAESHTDSPSLKVKGRKLIKSPEGYRINVEAYGGLIRYSMMDIPLKIAGRVFIATESGVRETLIESDFTVNIPSLCIHHNPEVNDKLSLNVQVDMLPLIGGGEEDLYKVLCGDNEVIDGDLYVVPAVSAFISGAASDLLCAPRIDNLTSVYTSVNALINAQPKGIAVCCCFDNEEIGSHTKQGACSEFLPAILKRINADLGMGEADYLSALENGMCLSIDNGHAVHPAHPEKSDVTEKVYLNGGVVIKHHANYSTDGYSSAIVKTVAKANGVSYQDYYNRSDLRCGGTLGLITSAQLQMDAADIGLAQLAMHSAIETVGIKDIEAMQTLVNGFFNASIKKKNNEITVI